MTVYKSCPDGYDSFDGAIGALPSPEVQSWTKNGWLMVEMSDGRVAQMDCVTVDSPTEFGFYYAVIGIIEPDKTGDALSNVTPK